jgi:hypothetical protein
MSSIRGKSGQKRRAHDEDGLISGCDAGRPRTPIDHAGDDGKEAMPPGNTQVESPPDAVSERRGNQPVGILGKRRVGMQEEKRFARAKRGAGIHRRGAPAHGGDDTVGKRPRQTDRRVAAAAVGDDHLGAAGAQWRQRLQGADDDGRFVEDRHDDGEPAHG